MLLRPRILFYFIFDIGIVVVAIAGRRGRRLGHHQRLAPPLHVVPELVRLLAQDFVERLHQDKNGIVHEGCLGLSFVKKNG